MHRFMYLPERIRIGAEEIRHYKKVLRPVLLHRVIYYAEKRKVTYRNISIRDQKK